MKIIKFIDEELYKELKKYDSSNKNEFYYCSFIKVIIKYIKKLGIRILYHNQVIHIQCTFHSKCEVYYRNLQYHYGDHQLCDLLIICNGFNSKLYHLMIHNH